MIRLLQCLSFLPSRRYTNDRFAAASNAKPVGGKLPSRRLIEADQQATFSLMRQYTLPSTYHANRSDRQLESSSEKEGVMNELPNSTIHPICPREKLLMLLRLGRFSHLHLGFLADDIVVGKVSQLARSGSEKLTCRSMIFDMFLALCTIVTHSSSFHSCHLYIVVIVPSSCIRSTHCMCLHAQLDL
jgi:hypothetical protein